MIVIKSSWFHVFLIALFIIDLVEMRGCGYRGLMKCLDVKNPSNSILNHYAAMEDDSRLRNIYEHFNFTRVVGSEGHARAREYIITTLRELNWDIKRDRFDANTPFGKKSFINVVASSSPQAATRLVLACHYDSKDYQGEMVFIGATDSAVPCAILIDIAKTLTPKLKNVRNMSLDLVFFDGEEAFGDWTSENSIYGAKHLAKKWLREEAPILAQKFGGTCKKMDSLNALILLDLIGERGLQLNNLYIENPCSTAMFSQFQTIESRLQAMEKQPASITIFSPYGYRGGLGIEDDHLPFKNAGVNIVHLIAYPFPSVWHTQRDHGGNLHWDTIHSLNQITRIFISLYFNLDS